MFNHGSVRLRKSPGTVCNVSDLSGFHREGPDPSPRTRNLRSSAGLVRTSQLLPWCWPGVFARLSSHFLSNSQH